MVDLFTPGEAVAYLRQRTGLDDDSGARVVAKELGWLPLALAQAATVIYRQGLEYRKYVQRVRALPLAQSMARPGGDPYPRGVVEAVTLSLMAVEEQDPSGLAGTLHQSAGRLDEAIALFDRILARTLVSRNNLAAARRAAAGHS